MLDSRKILRTYYTDAKVKFNTNSFPLSAYRYKIFCNSRNQNDHSCIEIRGVCSTMPNIYDEFFAKIDGFWPIITYAKKPHLVKQTVKKWKTKISS